MPNGGTPMWTLDYCGFPMEWEENHIIPDGSRGPRPWRTSWYWGMWGEDLRCSICKKKAPLLNSSVRQFAGSCRASFCANDGKIKDHSGLLRCHVFFIGKLGSRTASGWRADGCEWIPPEFDHFRVVSARFAQRHVRLHSEQLTYIDQAN